MMNNRKKKRFQQVTAVLLAVAMLVTNLELTALASPAEGMKEQVTEETAPEEQESVTEQEEAETLPPEELEPAELVGELEELRGEMTKHFLMKDGTVNAVQYDTDVHYQDEDGEWQEIDNSLGDAESEDSEDVSGYSNKEGKVKYKFAQNVNANYLVRIMQEEYHIFFSAENTQKKAQGAEILEEVAEVTEDTSLAEQLEVENNRSGILYQDLFKGTDVEYLLSGSSLKENIIVKEKQDSYEYVFEIKTNKVTIREEEDGSISFLKEGTDEKLYTIPQMYMWDAQGNESDAIETELKIRNKKSTLTIRADAEWINSEERIFPVTIDPTLQSTSSSVGDESRIVKNQYVSKGNPTVSSAGYGRGFLGYDTSSDKTYRLFVQFKKLPNIPENSVIIGSRFYYGQTAYDHVGMSSLTVAAKEVTEDWTWGTKVNWNTQPAYSSRVLDYQVLSSSTTGTYVGWDITKIIKNHYEKKDNTTNATSSFVLVGIDESLYGNTCAAKASVVQENSAGFFSSAQPVLVIAYRDTRGLEDYYTYQSLDLGKAGTGYISDYAKSLTFVRPVFQTTSSTIPFQLNLVYNSALGDKIFGSDAGLYTKDFSNMQMGMGWKMNVQETIIEKTISGTKHLIWSDGDGTDHYFPLDSGNTYKDEDGLKLTVVKSTSPIRYTMTDEQGNKKIFHNGFLSTIMDANGNALYLLYNNAEYSSGGTWYANTGKTNRLTKIVQVNKGQSTPKTIATFAYDGNAFLKSVTDNAGRTYTMGYTAATDVSDSVLEYNLTMITEPDDTFVRYEYYTITSHKVSKLARTYDSETKLGGRFRYNITKHSAKNNSYGVIVWTSETAYREERRVDITNTDPQQVYYRDWGLDATADTEDDIWTYCTFDHAGRTINQISMDSTGEKIYGASSTAYYTGTNAKNANKILSDVTVGVGGMNLLRNSGLELVSGGGPTAWTGEKKASVGTADKITFSYNTAGHIRSGSYSAQATIATDAQENTSGELGAAFRTTEVLESGETYSFSAYFKNTGKENFNDKSRAYLQVKDSSGNIIADSSVIDQCTSGNIEDGWSRLIVTFTAPSTGTYILGGHADWIYGTSSFDDFQLEKGTAASGYNYMADADAEDGDGWTHSEGASRVSGSLMYGEYCWKIVGSTTTRRYARTTINLNVSSDNTFVMSGWAKGAAGPDLNTTASTGRSYGLEVVLYYSDDTTEKQYVSFDGNTTHLQYVSMNVVPKKSGLIIEQVSLRYIYGKNANTVYFDGLSFRKEPVSCYKYDSDGNVTSVTEADKEDVNFKYSAGNLIQTKSEGNGVYDYTYDNKHNLTKVTNDGVDMNLTYDAMGHVKTTELKNTSENAGKTISTSAEYSSDGDYLTEQTDALGNSVSYQTNDKGLTSSVTDAMNNTVHYEYDPDTDVLESVYQEDAAGISYQYEEGVLTGIIREDLLPEGTGEEQGYTFTYDIYDNVTSVKAGDSTLVTYEYMAKNGPLAKITYGNGFYIEYEYDALWRVVGEKENGLLKYRYVYGAEGALTRQEELGIGGTMLRAVCYEYDSLGRLIRSWEEELRNGDMVRTCSTEHLYDTSNRLTSQSYKSSTEERSEEYTYDSDDGTLSGMKTASGENLQYTYDYLKRLQSRTDGTRSTAYEYQDVGDNGTSTRIRKITQTGIGENSLELEYEYDAAGNITKVIRNGQILAEYTYDALYQLINERLPQRNVEYTYSYDGGGNIRSITTEQNGAAVTKEYGYTDADWKDLLTEYEGEELTYDEIGNPLEYYNGRDWNFTWTEGRKLSSVNSSGNAIATYEYDAGGLRREKTVSGTEHTFCYLGEQLVEEIYGEDSLRFAYDEQGRPYSVEHNGTLYYYILNQQGDIIYIVDGSGNIQAEYVYNAWGKILEVIGTAEIGTINPLRYRGYYYDAETGFYYVSSRYYDPEVGRFIRPDTTDILGVDSDLYDKNLYAYCDNNPVTRADSSGELWFTVAGVAVGAALGAVSKITSNLLTGNDWKDGILGAAVSGAVYGGIATSPILRTSLGAHVNAIASYTSAAAESIVNETISYARGKKLTARNVGKSISKVVKDTAIEGTQTYVAGRVAANKVKTNRGWYRPKTVKSSFTGSYAKKTWLQSSVQAASITISNTVRGWWNKLWGR